jgi:hypothetical protein
MGTELRRCPSDIVVEYCIKGVVESEAGMILSPATRAINNILHLPYVELKLGIHPSRQN